MRLLGDMIMKAIIEKYGINKVWHFTDKANLDSIREHGGLLSLKTLNEKGIEIPVPGGDEWSHNADKSKGLDKYVHLTFVDHHPMLYTAQKDCRITDHIWLEIDVSIIMDSRVRFCSSVSYGKGAKLLDHNEAVKEIDFDVLFTYMDWKNSEILDRRNAAEKSEILVPNIVPIDKIMSFNNGKKTCICTAHQARPLG